MTAGAPSRGWWRRPRKPKPKDQSPFPDGFLPRLVLEVDAIRKLHRREVRPQRRRLARRAPEPDWGEGA